MTRPSQITNHELLSHPVLGQASWVKDGRKWVCGNTTLEWIPEGYWRLENPHCTTESHDLNILCLAAMGLITPF